MERLILEDTKESVSVLVCFLYARIYQLESRKWAILREIAGSWEYVSYHDIGWELFSLRLNFETLTFCISTLKIFFSFSFFKILCKKSEAARFWKKEVESLTISENDGVWRSTKMRWTTGACLARREEGESNSSGYLEGGE